MKKIKVMFLQFILLMIVSIPTVFAAVKISPKYIVLGVGDMQTLKASNATSDSVSWFSSNPNIVSVSANGLITGVGLGTAYVSATDGNTTNVCKVTIVNNYVPVSSISLAKSSATMVIGDTNKIELSIFPINASNKTPTYLSDKENIASVSDDGYVTAKSIGTASIYVSVENRVVIYKVKVVDKISLNSISISPSVKLKVNEYKKISVTYNPNDASNKKVTWKSSNKDIVAVDSNGNIKGVANGEATITVTSNDGNYSATCKVSVVANDNTNVITTDKSTVTTMPTTTSSSGSETIELRSIFINKSSLSLDVSGEEILTLTYNPSDATNKEVTWKSSDVSVATVDNNGKVKAIGAGKATITVTSTDGNHSATCEITVGGATEDDNGLNGISFDKTRLGLKVNKDVKLTVIFNPDDVTNKKVTWISTDEEIATVSDGVIKGLKPGKVDIKATSEDGNYEATCHVIVYLDAATESLSFEKERQTMYVGDSLVLEPISVPENTMLDNPIWSSSDEAVAMVVDGEVTALSVGTTTIMVSDESGNISTSIIINAISKPIDDLVITIEGYSINFDPKVKNYTLTIGSETSLNIKTNYDSSRIMIGGNRDLKNGSIITVTVTGDTKTKYVFNIKKRGFNIISLIVIVSIFLLLNIIRIVIKNKNKNK